MDFIQHYRIWSMVLGELSVGGSCAQYKSIAAKFSRKYAPHDSVAKRSERSCLKSSSDHRARFLKTTKVLMRVQWREMVNTRGAREQSLPTWSTSARILAVGRTTGNITDYTKSSTSALPPAEREAQPP